MTVANTLLNHKKKNHCSTNWDSILPFVFDLMRAHHRVVTNGYKGQATMLEERQKNYRHH